jgi:hypothetical protein
MIYNANCANTYKFNEPQIQGMVRLGGGGWIQALGAFGGCSTVALQKCNEPVFMGLGGVRLSSVSMTEYSPLSSKEQVTLMGSLPFLGLTSSAM